MSAAQQAGTPAPTTPSRIWSPQQLSVFEAVADSSPDAPHLVVEALAGCLAGSTEISVHRAGKGSRMPLRHVVHMFNGGKSSGRQWDLSVPTYVRAPHQDGTVRLARLEAATYSGMRRILAVQLADNRVLYGTFDHKILTPDGWIALERLGGRDVLVEASKLGPGRGCTPKRNYLKRHVPYHPHAVNSGNGMQSVPTHRLHIEAHMNGMDLEAFVWQLQTSAEGLKFLDPALHVHHKDENPWNNSLSNLIALTQAEHNALHVDASLRNIQTRLVPCSVVRIEDAGEAETFDLTVPGVNAFIADGIAVHNSGKTTTIVESLKHLPTGRRTLLVAFNKIIAKDLERRCPPGVEVRTLHSYGLRAITKAQGRRALDASAARARIVALGSAWERWEAQEARMACAKLVSAAKGSLCVPDLDALDDVIDTASIDLPSDEESWPRERIVTAAARVLQQTASDTQGPIDFDDMIWLPIVQKLPCATFASVFVDETQDLNPVQLELVMRAAGKRGRICAIGDRNQAIYGFRGAGRSAIPRMIEKLQAEVLPLSITYRCPKAVVREAQRYVPHFVAAESAPEGIVRHCDLDALQAGAAPGDFVISRLNAPLVSLAFHWLAAGRRCEIRGRDIGSGLASLVKKLAKGREEHGIEGLRGALDAWEGNEIRRLAAKDLDTTNVSDKAACIRALAEGATGIDALQGRIAKLFSDDDNDGKRAAGSASGIILTSAHRSKGLEADRVWMLRDTFRPEKGTQERNLCYVAITRAKRELVFVRGEAVSE